MKRTLCKQNTNFKTVITSQVFLKKTLNKAQ